MNCAIYRRYSNEKQNPTSIADQIRKCRELAKSRAREILTMNADPFKHLRDFEYLWIGADYCRELQDYGNLDGDVHVARCMGQDEREIRVWLIERLNKLAA